jgi:hypothetical protein
VFGTGKPAFNIIGDPINIASRLHTWEVAGHVRAGSGPDFNLGHTPGVMNFLRDSLRI